ncbi:BspA family leucine-rich repeat surface protein [Muricauda brasiliensis]|uniref:BspA family leucine-rich repeat surface protein n=1 Tax=Muricauda brasiliensis TaxID=2162892 RepID=UPI00131EF943|nr:BspA family leucine-rich repeat surface protein [Muricauda brasiliensis]
MKKILFSVVVVAMLWSCGKDDSPSTPPASTTPTINDFTPKTGPVGTEVTITGTNFSTTKADNVVKFGSTTATVNTASTTQLKIAVPTGAITGKISVTVDGETVTSTDNFTVSTETQNQAPEMADQEFMASEDITEANEIGQVAATDPDEDDTLTFELTANDNDLFAVSESGVLTLAEGKTLDFETAVSHSITVSVTDGEETVEATITITVEDVYENIVDDPASFVTTWKTEVDDGEVIVGANPEYDYDFIIDWGDGTVEEITESNPTKFAHIYETAGTYTVAIKGNFPAIVTGNIYTATTGEKITSIEQWGSIQWKTMGYAFSKAENMVYNASAAPDLTNVANMESMFSGATSFDGDISGWETSNVIEMQYMFFNAASFNGDISAWNTAEVNDMQNMFKGATSFNVDISGWNVSSVINMGGMFHSATSFDQDLGSWDIGSITTMANMLDNSGMSKENFNATIIGWHGFVDDNNGPLEVTLGTEGLTLCGLTAFEAATDLVASYEWNLQGAINVEAECN